MQSDDKEAQMEDLVFNGNQLQWHGKGAFKASSGMQGAQQPSLQCLPEKGPVPEGTYYLSLMLGGAAEDDGSGVCQLKPSWQIQTIPRGAAAGSCDPYWANWGSNRVRFEPADNATRTKCKPSRSGFYLHDSTKGYSHGCIEVQEAFFVLLRAHAGSTNKKRLTLRVTYKGVSSTYGGTYVP